MTEASRILLVEDDENLGYLLQDNLEMKGYAVRLCRDGEEGLSAFREQDWDLIILDVMMPKLNGFDLGQAIRSQNSEVALIFLTAKGMKEDRIKGLRIGADDYITKPFSIEEFLLRIAAILRRVQKVPPNPNKLNEQVLNFAGYQLDMRNLQLQHGEKIQQLTEREAQLLHFLGSRPNQLLRRDEILQAVWGDDSYFTGRSMDVFISRLRKLFKKDDRVQIVNIHGTGYRVEIPTKPE